MVSRRSHNSTRTGLSSGLEDGSARDSQDSGASNPVSNANALAILLGACAKQDRAAFERLYQLTAPRLYNLCLRMMKRRDLAEDVLQEAFLQIWRDAPRFNPDRAAPMTWMGSIVRHRALDTLRSRRSGAAEASAPGAVDGGEIADLRPTEDPGPMERLLAGADSHSLHRCLEGLSVEQRPQHRAGILQRTEPWGAQRDPLQTGGYGEELDPPRAHAPQRVSGSMNPRNPQLRSMLAAEYVLGTLRGPARKRLEHWLRSDPLLRGEVELWEARLYPLLDDLPETQPPAHLWERISEALDQSAPAVPPTVMRRVTRWRAGAFSAAILSLLLGIALVWQLRAPAPAPAEPVVAVVADDQARSAWLVQVAPREPLVRVSTLQPQPLARGKSFELWMIADATSAPRSLGLIPGDGIASLRVDRALAAALRNAAAVAVSLEPEGGSTTGAPTGPVLYQGALHRTQ